MVALAASGLAASSAQAMSSAEAVAKLNAARAANGIPGDLTVHAGMSDGCAKHLHYLTINDLFTHDENPALPGYTPEGAKEVDGAGGTEVLSGSATWDDQWSDPWADAPLHLQAMFDPAATESGWADEGNLSCMRFGYDRADQRRPGIYTLPGDGATGVPPIQDSTGEGPYSTADVAGVPDRTGYNILLWRIGGPNQIAAASLTGPRGAVDVRPIDSRSPTPTGGTLWDPAIVPAVPLDAGARYTATVRFTDGATHTWTFTTASDRSGLDRTDDAGGSRDPIGGGAEPGSDGAARTTQRVTVTFRRSARTLRITASATPGMRRWGLLTFKDRRGRTLSTRGIRVKTQTIRVPRAARSYRLTSAEASPYAALALRGRL